MDEYDQNLYSYTWRCFESIELSVEPVCHTGSSDSVRDPVFWIFCAYPGAYFIRRRRVFLYDFICERVAFFFYGDVPFQRPARGALVGEDGLSRSAFYPADDLLFYRKSTTDL